jgi:XTP/dITP diphosphohydrolase
MVLASRNGGKIREIEALLKGAGITLLTLNDYPSLPETVEDGASFLENALKKARAVAQATGETALADDSGLEVDALGGAPGIHSARYAGEPAHDGRNIAKLLQALGAVPAPRRQARFRCVLVLCRPDGQYEAFEGLWPGEIAEKPSGHGGFGYDPVFYLRDLGMTVAELAPEVKNRLSHRARALEKMKERLREAHPE